MALEISDLEPVDKKRAPEGALEGFSILSEQLRISLCPSLLSINLLKNIEVVIVITKIIKHKTLPYPIL